MWPVIIFEDDEPSDEDFCDFKIRGMSDILDLVTHLEKVSINEEELQPWIDIDNFIPVTHSLYLDDDDDKIVENVLGNGKEKDNEDKDDSTQTKKVIWKEAHEGLLTFIHC